ncbi:MULTISPECIES: aromatic acid exporter family protein [unclassified Anoxybacillus]|uniref:FUSC family protein n=2 Tax=Anoxybacillaceae TaxID=3120669 RepID=UPI001EDA2D4A|nr:MULTISPECIES: aromatic acid exporter family protein [unclassified Anoxybacillus]
MIMFKRFMKGPLIGGRVLKTGIAVFVTVIICDLLHLPTIFSVMTAIVTIEPTAHDSIKKGMIRFPASTIGSAYAMTLTYMFGHSAIAYALSAMFTIVTCQKLRLHAGTLVATITAVAMIPLTDHHYFHAFVMRIVTTSIGIFVSTLVNFFILPPNYIPFISKRLEVLLQEFGDVLQLSIQEMIEKEGQIKSEKRFEQLANDLHQTMQFAHFQQQDWKYHRHSMAEARQFYYERKMLNMLQHMHFHVGNFIGMSHAHFSWDNEEKELLRELATSIATILKSKCTVFPEHHTQLFDQLEQRFWETKKTENKHTHFSPKAVVFFELLSLHDSIEQLRHIQNRMKLSHSTLNDRRHISH